MIKTFSKEHAKIMPELFESTRLTRSDNPKDGVPPALPVGECESRRMVCLGHGNLSAWPMEFTKRSITLS